MDEQQQQPVWQHSDGVPEKPVKDKSNFAMVGFILGLCGLATWYSFFVGLGIIGWADGIVGIIMSIKGLKSSKRTFAIIGLVLSILCLVAIVVSIIIIYINTMNNLSNDGIKY